MKTPLPQPITPSMQATNAQNTDALLTGFSVIPATATVVLTSTFATRRLLDRLGVKRMLLIGLASMGIGQVLFSFMTSRGSYVVDVLPGLLLIALADP
jgi:MFS family permease